MCSPARCCWSSMRLLRHARAATAARRGAALGQEDRLRRRAPTSRNSPASASRSQRLRADPAGPAGARSPRGAALPDGGRHPWLCPRRRPRARARLPLSGRASTMSGCRSDFPRCSSASTRALAARCAACGCCGRAHRHGSDADRQPRARARKRAASDWSIGWCRRRSSTAARAARAAARRRAARRRSASGC